MGVELGESPRHLRVRPLGGPAGHRDPGEQAEAAELDRVWGEAGIAVHVEQEPQRAIGVLARADRLGDGQEPWAAVRGERVQLGGDGQFLGLPAKREAPERQGMTAMCRCVVASVDPAVVGAMASS
ncbi:hypothetical protein ACPPVO_21485 [Dactylosporangium sp. McL0621]|uniref:hypothetical protein n=1 Tax=Dactylosporangium sp. McL0621 TaxID=3415678 RepID=UPI003CF1C6F4